jgi:rod shape-determining protein MreC
MEALLNRYRNITVLLLVIIGQLLLLAFQVKGNQDVRLIRVWAVTAVTPFARILEGGRTNTFGFFRDYIFLRDVREENRALRAELGKLKLDNQYLKSELETADRARALSAFQSRTPSKTAVARIIANGTGANSKAVFVDLGSNNGVMAGMAAVTPDGIVGRVLASYPTASQVLLITDPTFAAGVISQKNRVHGAVKGQGHGTCLVDYVPNEQNVEVGEWFFTSGDDRVFPKGMPVGTVKAVRPGKTFKEILLIPSGAQSGLEEVLIVLEGVHQEIPAAATASSAVYILPPPPDSAAATAAVPQPPSQGTEADKLLQRYRRIGEAQGHVYGSGGPGAKPPDFNLDPNRVPPKPVPEAGGTQPPAASSTPASPPKPVAPPATPPAGSAAPTGGTVAAPVKSPAVDPKQTAPVRPGGTAVPPPSR